MLGNLLNFLFTAYSLLLLARIIGSWFMKSGRSQIWVFICQYTDPYLNLFRRFIPPLGNLDISPIVAFFVLRIVQRLILSLFR